MGTVASLPHVKMVCTGYSILLWLYLAPLDADAGIDISLELPEAINVLGQSTYHSFFAFVLHLCCLDVEKNQGWLES